MGVPSNVVQRINRLEIARKRVEDRKRADLREQERRNLVALDRKARRPLLMDLASSIFEWREDLVRSRDGQRLWNVLGAGAKVFLLEGWFWDGLPIPAGNAIGARTCVFLDGPNHHFLFEEWRNDDEGNLAPYQELWRVKSPLEMVDLVHPMLIETLQTHLTGPEAWETIVGELDRRIDRYVRP